MQNETNEPAPVRDCVGNVITAGCTVVYPVRAGSSMWMSRMVVTQVSLAGISGYRPDSRRVHVKNIQNVAVVCPPTP